MSLAQFLSTGKQEVEAALERILPKAEGDGAVLFESMRYGVFAGGKRLRPCLFLATVDTFGGDRAALLDFAAALELIHSYSLIHDDLPAMDDDDYRRGKPTCHKIFGEAQAILAGDALLTYAFQVMAGLKDRVPPGPLLAAIAEVSRCAGVYGMVLGQVADIAWEGEPLNLEQLQFIHRHKTGALFSASILSAAILCEANAAELEALRSYALQLGLAFQIADDLLDMHGDESKTGRPQGSDLRNHKTTYATLFGLEQAKRLAQTAAQAARDALAPLGARAGLLLEMPAFFVEREY